MPLAVLLPAINLPFVALGLHQMGVAFAIRSAIGIAGLAGALAFMPFPDVTPDLVLTAVFGGFFLGAGIGLAIRGGAVLDGTEIAALLVSRRGDVLRVGDVILGFNVVLFLAAMAVLGVDAGALFDPDVSRGGENAGFRHQRYRRVHSGHDRVRSPWTDPAADHARPRPRRHDLPRVRRHERTRA